MPQSHYDAIIIGAGFAGVTAARELSKANIQALILEGRDRIGGRTWIDQRLGCQLELGGAWVHWFQPHIWSEITRYGLEVRSSPTPQKVYWDANGQVHTGTLEDWFGKMDSGMKSMLSEARKYFPNPYDPLQKFSNLKKVDHISVAEKLAELGLTKEAFDLVYSLWSLHFNSRLEAAGLTQAFRLAALVNNDWKLILETSSVYKIIGGTKLLIEAILKDAPKANLQLSAAVIKVKKVPQGFIVCTSDGREYTSEAVIAALPVNVLNDIDFVPPLSSKKREAASEKQAGTGFKFWARVQGKMNPFILLGPASNKINYVQMEGLEGEDTILVGFGCNSSHIDMDNEAEIEMELRRYIPEIRVIESTGHDWAADPFSQGTWSMLKKHQLTKYLCELQREENGILLAGSDYANGWAGFIDGAIESGITTGRKAAAYIGDKNSG